MNLAKSGTTGSGSNDLRHAARTEHAMRSHNANEYRPTLGALWPAPAQIGGHGFAGVSGQRQALCFVSLTVKALVLFIENFSRLGELL